MKKWQGVRNCRVVRVIQTGEAVGKGTEDDPCRGICKLWTLDGKLICVIDPQGGYVTERLDTLSDCE